MNKQLATIVNRIGGHLLPDNDRYTNRFELKSSSSNRLYTIAQVKSGVQKGQWKCGCHGYIAHNHGDPNYQCKHLRSVMPSLKMICN